MSDSRKDALLLQDIPQDEGTFARMLRKVQRDPAVTIGMAGWTGLVCFGLYNIKKRKTSIPLYLIHLRVTAQVFAIGCMVSAVGYKIYVHEMKKFTDKPVDEK